MSCSICNNKDKKERENKKEINNPKTKYVYHTRTRPETLKERSRRIYNHYHFYSVNGD